MKAQELSDVTSILASCEPQLAPEFSALWRALLTVAWTFRTGEIIFEIFNSTALIFSSFYMMKNWHMRVIWAAAASLLVPVFYCGETIFGTGI